ncbi:MAG: pachytene checkpoint protein 2 [Solirubrobacteraceae bacterium]|jgi:AAA+ superfamily predicted ATPase|nr:pachytene checkpoint protein 2 [Solirubrobacteraceae bacterium]
MTHQPHPALSIPRPGTDPALAEDWRAIFVPAADKQRLVHHALLGLTLRQGSHASLPIHGLILLSGPPGTGKTTLARGLTSVLSAQLGDRLGPVTLVELNPHALTSELHGQTQRGVVAVLEDAIPALAADGPTVLLLDEVEALAVARSVASMETNPADLHRATDAVLAGVDRLARECPKLIIVATTNFSATVDSAFVSRADVVIEVGLPGIAAIEEMLRDTLATLAEVCEASPASALRRLIAGRGVRDVAKVLDGLDGRQVRKFVVAALASDAELTLAPERLDEATLLAHARNTKIAAVEAIHAA